MMFRHHRRGSCMPESSLILRCDDNCDSTISDMVLAELKLEIIVTACSQDVFAYLFKHGDCEHLIEN